MILAHPLIASYIFLATSSAVYGARLAREDVEDVSGWTYFNQTDSYYKKFTDKQSFDDAEKKCQEYNHSHLTSFHSKLEFDFLLSLSRRHVEVFGLACAILPDPD
uniref:C-type lectin domain-containing protein n=1 Tax=Ditylenchus dipsaci TaxID=166011 RepID=A0A915DUP3_9BILA